MGEEKVRESEIETVIGERKKIVCEEGEGSVGRERILGERGVRRVSVFGKRQCGEREARWIEIVWRERERERERQTERGKSKAELEERECWERECEWRKEVCQEQK